MDILRETGADAVMIARGAQGNPMIFADCLALWQGKPLPEHTPEEIVALMRRQAELCVARKGESAMVELRKHGLWYLDRFRAGRRLKPEMSMISTLSQFHSICDQILEQGFTCKKGDGTL
jgi:tRNA-dihydrouridine synthase